MAETLGRLSDSDPWLKDHPPELIWFEGQFESGQIAQDAPIVQALSACHKQVVGEAPAIRGVTYGSDLRLFTNHGNIPAVLYGPGDVMHAHTVDEFVEIEEVVTATKVLALIITQWCGGTT
jgi:acetylornithine deacetylase